MELRTSCRILAAGAAAALALVLTAGTAGASPGKPDSSAAKTSSGTAAVKPSSGTGTVTKAVNPVKAQPQPVPKKPADAPKGDGGYTLKGGQDRTDFRSLTVEGEDRIHVEIERPRLALELNPADVKGLDFGSARDVLDRVSPDLTSEYLAVSATGTSPYTARPWLRQFASGSVARFQPAVRGTERWKLTVADSRGQTVAQFGGKGEAPREIVWDGRSLSGAPVAPGITYSYVFEAIDKAGNKRNFVGRGFRVSAYRLDSPQGPVLVFTGQALQEGAGSASYGPGGAAVRPAPPIVLEAASTLNQSTRVAQPIRVNVTGRSYEQANAVSKQVAAWLADLTIGDPSRVQSTADVQADAPDGGTVRIAIADAPTIPSAAPSAKPFKPAKESKKKSKH